MVRDDRCGSNQTDFVTPEYATYSAQLVRRLSSLHAVRGLTVSRQSQKWESSEGMDPFSYGYNSDTSVHLFSL